MRHLVALCGLLLCAAGTLADEQGLKQARQRWLRGNYEEARSQYQTLAKESKYQVGAAIGISRAWQSEGEHDKALAAVDDALKKHAKNAPLLARRAELLYLRGQWKDASEAAEQAIAADKDSFLARWVRAQLLRDRGELKQADVECRWFVRTYSERSNADKDITDPEELLLVGLAGAENARWHSLSDQFGVILNHIYGDALKNDKDFWLAEYEAGMLLLEKYNRPEALRAFDKALAINPQAAEVLVGKGLAALHKFEIGEAEKLAERALKINPKLVEALHLSADVQLMGGDVDATFKELAKARQVNPRDESTLGRIAACLFVQRKQKEFDALAAEVQEHDTKPGIFYYELAERLEERRYFDPAEKYYQKAIELRPMLPWPKNSLGLLLLRLGREKEGREILEKAREADPFNVRISNSLKVLRHLDKYDTIKTAHFELRYDPKTDGALARYMAEQLELMYDELAKKFDYRPKGPILVEVFNNHEMFSGRVVALPDLHTIGACTGRMFAMVSPTGKGIAKPFSWSRVLRHELVHIFNLEQTNFQCPHWLTEGLAVINEEGPRPQSWNQILLEKVPANDLLNLDTINLGFIRPRSQVQWHQAYCQSQLYVEYLTSKFGPQTVGQLLEAYRDGLDTSAAIAKVCKVDKATFEKGYVGYVQDVVKSLKGKPAEKTLTFAQLQDAVEKEPANADLSARLAEAFLLRRRNAEARKLVEKILAKDKTHALATYVKAQLLRSAGDDDEARKLLEAAVDPKAPEPKVLETLGKIYFEASELQKAADIYELAHKAQPHDAKWLTELVKVYGQLGQKDKQIDALKELAPTDPDDLDVRKRLAKMLLEKELYAEAEKFGRQALEINIQDRDARDLVTKALVGQKKDAEAKRLEQLLGK